MNTTPSARSRRAAAQFNKALHRTGTMPFDLMRHWFYSIIGFGGRSLPGAGSVSWSVGRHYAS